MTVNCIKNSETRRAILKFKMYTLFRTTFKQEIEAIRSRRTKLVEIGAIIDEAACREPNIMFSIRLGSGRTGNGMIWYNFRNFGILQGGQKY